VWFPDAQRVLVLGVAVGPEGKVLASGTANKADGTKAFFVLGTDASGKIIKAIQTNPFFPSKICAAPDGTIWSFGDLGDITQPTDNLLRQFSLEKGLIASYLPRAIFGGNGRSPAQSGNEGQEVYLRCNNDRVIIYSGVSNFFVEFDTTSKSAKVYRIDRSSVDLGVRGFALTGEGDVYGYLRDRQLAMKVQGLFHLDLDSAKAQVRWVPVKGASGLDGEPRVSFGLYGADGNVLVHGYDGDAAGRAGVSWTAISRTP
jgi:hypothetical protein